jgi:hypothetical protein
MKAAVLKIAALGALALLGLASAVGATRGTGGPVETVTSVVSSVTSQTGAVGTATGAATDPASGGAASDPSSTAGGAAGGTAESTGGSAAALQVPRLRTTFDRLPSRLEVLLERLVVGQKPGANLRRLEHALRAAAPQLRARVLRLLRAEMRKLKRGGLTPIERDRYRRLHRVLKALSQAGSSSATGGGGAPLPAQSGDQEIGAPSGRGAPNSTSPGDSHPFTGTDSQPSSGSKAGEDRDVGGFGSRADLPPAWEWNIQLGIYLVLLGLLLFALAALLLAAVPADALPISRLRRFVRRSRAALALMGASTLVALALIVFL